MPAAIDASLLVQPDAAASRKFAYRARRGNGELVRGVLEAPTHEAAVRQLRREGLVVLSIELGDLAAAVGQKGAISRNRLSARFRNDDVIALCQQLAVMMKTGVPLAEALETFSEQAARPEVATVVRAIKDDVCEGEEFSAALAKWPRIFPSILVSLMQAAEASGTMDEMLSRVAKDLLKARKTAKQVKGAMVYPGIMLAVAITAVTVIMVFVLPTFAPLFKAQGDRLPVLTKWLLMASAFLKGWWHLYLPALAALCFAATVLARTARGRLAIDWAKLNLPIISPMFRQLYVARMTNTMGTLLAAGVPLLEVIRITKAVTANTYWDRMWDDLRERVNHGQEMSPTLLQAVFIPRNISAMFNAGERAGRLPEVLERIAAFAEEELDAAIKTVTGMIEPLMIIFMGVVVGGIAASILLPIFRMSQSVH